MSELPGAGTAAVGYQWDGTQWTPVAGVVVEGYTWSGTDWVPEPGVTVNGYQWDGTQWSPVAGAVVDGYRWDGARWVVEPEASAVESSVAAEPVIRDGPRGPESPPARPKRPLLSRPAFWVVATVAFVTIALVLNQTAPSTSVVEEESTSAPFPSPSFLTPASRGDGMWAEVGPGPRAIVVNPSSGGVYVANTGGDGDFSVSLVELGMSQVYREDRSLGYEQPEGLALDPAGGTLFIAHPGQDGSSVDVVGIGSFDVRRTITLRGDGGGIALSPEGRRLYVVGFDAPTLTIIDVRSGRTLSTVRLGANAGGLALDEATHRLFVGVDDLDQARYRIVVVDTRTDKILRSMDVGHQPLALAVGRSSQLWMSDPNYGGLFRIDPDTGKDVGSIDTDPNILGITCDPDRDRLFATDYQANRLYVYPLP